ncbi:MAG: hypothetical protein OEY97_07610, partial [Nitrospirota bacterium]|nr:hypothetical protein [Nitrospirota bacterium]
RRGLLLMSRSFLRGHHHAPTEQEIHLSQLFRFPGPPLSTTTPGYHTLAEKLVRNDNSTDMEFIGPGRKEAGQAHLPTHDAAD